MIEKWNAEYYATNNENVTSKIAWGVKIQYERKSLYW